MGGSVGIAEEQTIVIDKLGQGRVVLDDQDALSRHCGGSRGVHCPFALAVVAFQISTPSIIKRPKWHKHLRWIDCYFSLNRSQRYHRISQRNPNAIVYGDTASNETVVLFDLQVVHIQTSHLNEINGFDGGKESDLIPSKSGKLPESFGTSFSYAVWIDATGKISTENDAICTTSRFASTTSDLH
jgi:hypothetical protein